MLAVPADSATNYSCYDRQYLLVYVDRLQSRRDERLFVAMPRVHVRLFRSARHCGNVLDGVLRHEVPGRVEAHHWAIIRSRYGRLALLAVRVLKLLRYTHTRARAHTASYRPRRTVWRH